MRLVKVVHEHPGATLVPPASLKLDLERALGMAGDRRRSGDLKVSGYQAAAATRREIWRGRGSAPIG